ncbi:TrmH family RNA methyltransferase [Aureibacter tunicatorum]|uniref:tRNA (guanosine(18)-2'-O)-methyltransferase n=1 Tax=Aureibacter tunicatorum TaxID=866807 RepID=A0AAE3XTC0_9BACT|nr:RNA methyltransferase [Aureibacter tunicatorum]MDR6241279.1 tRNA (guanosine-2'-O-)-methyltransferase [Aureibacter tunicatorum]BDD03539.1 tRNA (guanosine(18)-2'-O)-methyltransferase [Aureibacter tunicatorum]
MTEENILSPDDRAFCDYLEGVITEHKRNLIHTVLQDRTRWVSVVLENIYKPHNASAIMRTCDCFGVQDLYMIEQESQYRLNPYVAKGAGRWVDVHQFHEENTSNTRLCYEQLKAKGYKIYATSPHAEGVSVSDIPLDQKVAIVLGNEHQGLSDEALELADAYVTLPMYGFTESFNISVTAAICLHDLTERLHKSDIEFKLNENEKEALKYHWYQSLVKNLPKHRKGFENKKSS